MKTSRATSLLTIRSIDEDAREIEGIATAPEPDRYGDVVEPKGAVFRLPLPLLNQHRSDEPIGHVNSAVVTPAGITIRASIVRIEEPGVLRDRTDGAWQAIKSGLVRGLSIGFRALKSEPRRDAEGIRFLSWEWLELSAVTIPAHQSGAITSVRALRSAASGSRRISAHMENDEVVDYVAFLRRGGTHDEWVGHRARAKPGGAVKLIGSRAGIPLDRGGGGSGVKLVRTSPRRPIKLR